MHAHEHDERQDERRGDAGQRQPTNQPEQHRLNEQQAESDDQERGVPHDYGSLAPSVTVSGSIDVTIRTLSRRDKSTAGVASTVW